MIPWRDIAGEDDVCRILLPWPPATGTLWERLRRKDPVPTYQFRRWLMDAGALAGAQHPPVYDEKVALGITLCCDSRERLFDFGDRREAVLTLLVQQGILLDAAYARHVEVERVTGGAPCAVVIAPLRRIPRDLLLREAAA